MTPEEAYQKVEHVLANPKTVGWCAPEKNKYLFDLVLEHKPKTVVEMGVYGGKSLCSFAAASLVHPCKVYAIDAWERSVMSNVLTPPEWDQTHLDAVFRDFQQVFQDAGLVGAITLMKLPSVPASVRFGPESIDIFHLDGSHAEEDCLADYFVWAPKIKPGGIFIIDDANFNELQLLQTFALRQFDHVRYVEGSKTRVFRKK